MVSSFAMSRAFHKTIGLKVDVDTFDGMRNGVPTLLSLFEEFRIKASFFVPMGRDHTGRTVKRVFTKKGFLKKASRVGVLETYGIRTLMRGVLLPGPEIASKNRELLHRIIAEGHELGIHGHDHVAWHDHVKGWSKEKTWAVLGRACDRYRELVGHQPRSFASPGWMINAHALEFLENNGFLYSSDTRGARPFLPVMNGIEFGLIQIPTTLPTLDEVVGLAGRNSQAMTQYFLNSLGEGLNILTVHTELEGKRWSDFLRSFIDQSLGEGFVYLRLDDVARACKDDPRTTPHEIVYGSVEGRAGEVSCQKGSERP